MTDPFAAAPEEPQTAPETETRQPAIATAYVDVKPRLEGFNNDSKVVLTFKGGSGFDAPWIVVHATDLDDALDHVSAENSDKFLDLMSRVQNVGRHFAGLAPARTAASGGAPQRPLQPGQPAGSVEAPSWAPPKPEGCGDFVYVTKIKADTGRPWHAWMAPEKGDTRKPLFFNPVSRSTA